MPTTKFSNAILAAATDALARSRKISAPLRGHLSVREDARSVAIAVLEELGKGDFCQGILPNGSDLSCWFKHLALDLNHELRAGSSLASNAKKGHDERMVPAAKAKAFSVTQ